MKVICLIPAWNEAARIGAVLAAVAVHPDLGRVIVIDDGSTDATAEIARAAGVEVLQTTGNLGKTRALAMAFARLRTEAPEAHILLLDADLLGLKPADVSALIAPVKAGNAGASLSLRGNAPRTWRLIGLDYITGERVLPLSLIAPHLEALQSLPRFGFEVFLNRLLIAEKVALAIVPWPDVASPSKAAKRGNLWAGIAGDIGMMRDIFRTIPLPEAISQIRAMRALRISGSGLRGNH